MSATSIPISSQPDRFKEVPDHLFGLIRSYLKFPEEPFVALDMKAQDGAALLGLLAGTEAKPYAVSSQSMTAKCRAEMMVAEGMGLISGSRVIKGWPEQVRISRDAFGLVYVNFQGEDGWEPLFGRRHTEYLRAGGILVAVIPQARLGAISRLLATGYEDVQVLRYPDDEYAIEQNVVVMGRKRRTPAVDLEAAEQFKSMAELPPEFLPVLSAAPEPIFEVPVTVPVVPTFQSSVVDAEEALEIARNSRVWAKAGEVFSPVIVEVEGKPPIPLHSGHITQLMAAGAFNGIMGTGDQRHMVSGQVLKETVAEDSIEEDEDGFGYYEVLTETEVFKVKTVILTPKGEFIDLT